MTSATSRLLTNLKYKSIVSAKTTLVPMITAEDAVVVVTKETEATVDKVVVGVPLGCMEALPEARHVEGEDSEWTGSSHSRVR